MRYAGQPRFRRRRARAVGGAVGKAPRPGSRESGDRRAGADRVRAEAPIELHPKSDAEFRKRIEALQDALKRPDGRSEAAALLRPLIAAIQEHRLPERGAYELRLAVRRPAILAVAMGQESALDTAGALVTAKLVAGEGFEPPTKGL